MHGLVTPAPIAWRPETVGWLILLSWFLAISIIGAWYLFRRRRRNRYRRDALKMLKAINHQQDLEPAESAQRIAALLKRTALAAYPREQVASLYGADWSRFLIESTNHDSQIVAAAEMFGTAAYRADADGRKLSGPARRWIRLHRA